MASRYQVVITDLLNDDLCRDGEVLGDLAGVTALMARCEDTLAGRIEEADALIVYHEINLTRASIGRLRKCRVIVRGGVGYDNIDGKFARECGIPSATRPTTAPRRLPTPGAGNDAVAYPGGPRGQFAAP